ncbi:MAG: hypothetical protein WBF66_06765 [Dehalococcoidia bacterium]
METIAIHPDKYNSSTQPHFTSDVTDLVSPVAFDRAIFRIRRARIPYSELEAEAFSSLAEAAFAEDWDSDADAIYDGM